MLALTFFGILHVPINVPALARQCGEDNADLDVELKLHGLSNLASGLAGSIQNYLVYANTTFFMRSGGDTRLAGFMLAALTTAVMVLGPVLVGFIPVMMVGTLIFDLGFELLLEALWEPRRRMRPVEYATVVAIVLVMGVYDFVVGIGVGILLAFVSLIVQSSRVSPVRGSYTGAEVTSTVRRSPSQHAYLHRAGRQIYIVKLTGYLFFGTIVSVEAKMRALLEGQQQQQRQPAAAATTTTAGHGGRAGGGGRIRYVVIDLWHVSGLDYSAGEGFNTVSRLLRRRGITLLLSGVADGGEIAKSLRLVGLGCGGGGGAANEDGPTASGDGEVMLLPDLNSALESCENELLKTLYASEAAAALARRGNGRRPSTGQQHHQQQQQQQSFQDIAVANRNPLALIDAAMPRSPRQSDLHEAAALTLLQHAPPCTPPLVPSHRYSPETPAHRPVPPSPALTLLLRILRAVGGPSSAVDESFWAPAAALFHRLALPPGALLFRRGEPARGFYLVERGVLRAEYNLPQGRLSEMIVAGTTCGELPFFSGTLRTARVVVDGGGAAREGGPAWEDEGAASHLVESAGGETALLEEGGEEEGEAGCVLWVLGADGWARLRTQRPDVAQELLTLALKLTSERMASITSYVLAVAG
jgi:SulP family sulfate permease